MKKLLTILLLFTLLAGGCVSGGSSGGETGGETGGGEESREYETGSTSASVSDSVTVQAQVLDLIFNSPKEGDRLYVRNPSGTPEQTSLFIGSPQAARAQTRYDFHQVTGDFSGWFLALGLNAHWSL